METVDGSVRWATMASRSRTTSEFTPGDASVPDNVNVFPLHVCPYVMIVPAGEGADVSVGWRPPSSTRRTVNAVQERPQHRLHRRLVQHLRRRRLIKHAVELEMVPIGRIVDADHVRVLARDRVAVDLCNDVSVGHCRMRRRTPALTVQTHSSCSLGNAGRTRTTTWTFSLVAGRHTSVCRRRCAWVGAGASASDADPVPYAGPTTDIQCIGRAAPVSLDQCGAISAHRYCDDRPTLGRVITRWNRPTRDQARRVADRHEVVAVGDDGQTVRRRATPDDVVQRPSGVRAHGGARQVDPFQGGVRRQAGADGDRADRRDPVPGQVQSPTYTWQLRSAAHAAVCRAGGDLMQALGPARTLASRDTSTRPQNARLTSSTAPSALHRFRWRRPAVPISL